MGAVQTLLTLHLSKYHVVGNNMSRLICTLSNSKDPDQMQNAAFHQSTLFAYDKNNIQRKKFII